MYYPCCVSNDTATVALSSCPHRVNLVLPTSLPASFQGPDVLVGCLPVKGLGTPDLFPTPSHPSLTHVLGQLSPSPRMQFVSVTVSVISLDIFRVLGNF